MVSPDPGRPARSSLSDVSEKQAPQSQVENPQAIHPDSEEALYPGSESQTVGSGSVHTKQFDDGNSQQHPQFRSTSAPDLNRTNAGPVARRVASFDGFAFPPPDACSTSADPAPLCLFPQPNPRKASVAKSESELQQVDPGTTVEPSDKSLSAASVPRSPSTSPSARRADSPPPPPIFKEDQDDSAHTNDGSYREIIGLAASAFGHIGRYSSLQSRKPDSYIICTDFTHASHSRQAMVRGAEHFAQLCRSVPTNITHRLFLVEDLSQSVIELLGQYLSISPEFFEEHLINSGYIGAEYDDPPASSWSTSGMKKSYTCLKWYRPVWRLPTVPYSKQDLDDLLVNDRLEYATSKPRVVKVFETVTNIFRSEWELWTDPKTTSRKKRLCGWEERLSVWSGNVPGSSCKFVLLVDPLPRVGESLERETFITSVREEGTSSISSTEDYSEDPDDGDVFEGDLEALDPPLVRVRERKLQYRQSIMLQSVLRPFSKTKHIRKGPPEKKFRRFVPLIEQTGNRVRLDADPDNVFQSVESLQNLKSQICNTFSTTEMFGDILDGRVGKKDRVGGARMLNPLFEMVRHDMQGLLKLLENVLESINLGVLDDATMEERLSIWRQIITRAQLELPQIHHDIKKFFTFLQEKGNATVENTSGQSTIDSGELKDLSTQIEEMLKKLQGTSVSLTSNMSLLDSRRSIAEAKSVTKLTELAFFFIPLTFAATLFGMQVQPLENRAPLSTFILIGAGFTTSSYLIRLLLRSTWLRNLRDAGTSSIKTFADRNRHPMQRGSVPTSLFLQWLFHEVRRSFVRTLGFIFTRTKMFFTILLRLISMLLKPFRFIIVGILYISLICAIPMAVLWTRHMEHDVQVAITAAFFTFTSLPVFLLHWNFSTSKERNALPRLIMRIRNNSSWFTSLFAWITVICSFVAPVATMWVGTLERGIKAAVTVALLSMLVMYSMMYWLKTALLSGLRKSRRWQTASSYAESLVSS